MIEKVKDIRICINPRIGYENLIDSSIYFEIVLDLVMEDESEVEDVVVEVERNKMTTFDSRIVAEERIILINRVEKTIQKMIESLCGRMENLYESKTLTNFWVENMMGK